LTFDAACSEFGEVSGQDEIREQRAQECNDKDRTVTEVKHLRDERKQTKTYDEEERAAEFAVLVLGTDRVAWGYRAVTAKEQLRQRRGTAGVIAPPPVIYLAFLGLGFVLEGLLPGAELPAWAQWTGAVVIVAGVVLVISFERAFKRAGTDANPYRPSTALATDGPYRFSRNPAYLGMAITYIGITLAAEAPWALVMLVPATLLMQYGVILREERYLEGLFGDEYLSYKRTTRRWI
jgi:protein-S-isoprenylcysteine O-methyltransferase Ste14